jgi:hypothetical protein
LRSRIGLSIYAADADLEARSNSLIFSEWTNPMNTRCQGHFQIDSSINLKMLKINMLKHVLIAKPHTLSRNMLELQNDALKQSLIENSPSLASI